MQFQKTVTLVKILFYCLFWLVFDTFIQCYLSYRLASSAGIWDRPHITTKMDVMLDRPHIPAKMDFMQYPRCMLLDNLIISSEQRFTSMPWLIHPITCSLTLNKLQIVCWWDVKQTNNQSIVYLDSTSYIYTEVPCIPAGRFGRYMSRPCFEYRLAGMRGTTVQYCALKESILALRWLHTMKEHWKFPEFLKPDSE